MTYDESVTYISGRIQFALRLDRERFHTLLARLGDPHKAFRSLHVAGTNGKGSTTTFLDSVLRAAGYRVGAYLSPFVFDLRERVLLNGAMISREDFARHVTAIRPHVEALEQTPLGSTTEFELKTAVAFRHFAEQEVDFAVIEVGIGGRLDSTNVIPPPLVALITSIGWDHKNLLGDTLAKIASEKAGILKPGTLACVTAVPDGEAFEAISEVAAERGVPLQRVLPVGERAYATYATRNAAEGDATITLPTTTLNLHLGLRGPFQATNAAGAAAALDVLRQRGVIRLSDETLKAGLESASLPGRFQILRDGRDGAPALVLDVAHNEDGALALTDALRAVFGPERPYTFVVGMSKGHEPEPFLTTLASLKARIVATAPEFRPKPAEEIVEAAKRLGLPVTVHEPAAEAIATTYRNAVPGEVVVVTGSFYTVGETPPELL